MDLVPTLRLNDLTSLIMLMVNAMCRAPLSNKIFKRPDAKNMQTHRGLIFWNLVVFIFRWLDKIPLREAEFFNFITSHSTSRKEKFVTAKCLLSVHQHFRIWPYYMMWTFYLIKWKEGKIVDSSAFTTIGIEMNCKSPKAQIGITIFAHNTH